MVCYDNLMNHIPPINKLSSWFPLGPYLRIFLVIFSLIGFAGDLLLVGADESGQFQLLIFLIPYLSLIGLGFGVEVASYLWFTNLVLAIFLYANQPVEWNTLIPASIIVPLYYAFLQSKRKSTTFAILNLVFWIYTLLSGTISAQTPMLSVLIFTTFSFSLGLVLHHYKSNLTQSKQHILDLQEAQRRARKEERTRLAHELHDIVAHEVTVIAMQARRAQFAKNQEQTERILTGIGDSASQALDDLRKLVSVLKAADAEEAQERNQLDLPSPHNPVQLLDEDDLSGETTTAIGLTHDLHKITGALENSGFTVALNITGDTRTVPATSRQVLRRTAREFGTNILKHGTTQHPVQLSLTVTNKEVALTSTNTVSSEQPISSTQTGLESIKARFDALGGTATYNENEGIWSIQVVLPLSSA